MLVQPSVYLCRFRLFLEFGDSLLLLLYHLRKLLLAFFSRLGVDIEFLSATVGESWEVASFPQVIIDLISASRASLAVFGLPRLEIFLNFARLRLPWLILRFGHRNFCTADFSVDFHRRLSLAISISVREVCGYSKQTNYHFTAPFFYLVEGEKSETDSAVIDVDDFIQCLNNNCCFDPIRECDDFKAVLIP